MNDKQLLRAAQNTDIFTNEVLFFAQIPTELLHTDSK